MVILNTEEFNNDFLLSIKGEVETIDKLGDDFCSMGTLKKGASLVKTRSNVAETYGFWYHNSSELEPMIELIS
jgi:hypothetical protein